jgi:5-methylcytosine-specific restriction protein A
MPTKPMRPCRWTGCPHLTLHPSGYCEQHLKQERRRYDDQRGTANQRGYTYRWRQASALFIAGHPLCSYCQEKDPPVITAAVLVDHFVPHRGDMELFWDETNWRSCCDECHRIKTAKEDGAFGNMTGRGD